LEREDIFQKKTHCETYLLSLSLSLSSPFKPTPDPLVRRVTVLAEAASASDRQTKVAACEMLHALFVYMIGKHATDPDRKAKNAVRATKRRFVFLYHLFVLLVSLL
jgi:DNA-dependent protein kinase catalytic subunit